MPTRRLAHRTAHAVDRRLDRMRAPLSGNAVITSYRGFGRAGEIIVRGRVLADQKVTRATSAEPLWRNIINTYRRFRTDEIDGALVRARFNSAVGQAVTDEEGFFEIRLAPTHADEAALWHEVALELPEHGSSAVSHVIIPPSRAEFAIISDIDDTIVHTGATSLLRMARSVTANAAARLPFEGVAELYSALHRGSNPIFYVSSSPWNLYELLHDFMDINGIPHGPMFLQDWGIDAEKFIVSSHEEHKMDAIERLIDYYPALRFVLIGDSGQHDPEIYLRVIHKHPGRVIAAFIRDVTDDLRDRHIGELIENAKRAGVEMFYVRHSAEALRQSKHLGLVS